MKISQLIKQSIDAVNQNELDLGMLLVCLAVDGTAKKQYPKMKVGDRFKKFILENIDIIELMHGGINFEETIFPFSDKKGNVGMKFEEIIYEKFRCNLAHGDELPEGYGILPALDKNKVPLYISNAFRFDVDVEQIYFDTKNQYIKFPKSIIFALGFACVMSFVNKDQQIGDINYYYSYHQNRCVIDWWWGKIECARQILPVEKRIRVRINFELK